LFPCLIPWAREQICRRCADEAVTAKFHLPLKIFCVCARSAPPGPILVTVARLDPFAGLFSIPAPTLSTDIFLGLPLEDFTPGALSARARSPLGFSVLLPRASLQFHALPLSVLRSTVPGLICFSDLSYLTFVFLLRCFFWQWEDQLLDWLNDSIVVAVPS
jgi:hypothetical protein